MQPSAARHCRHCLHIPPPFFTAYFTNGLKLLLVGVDETTQIKVQKYLPQPYYQIYKYDRPEDALRYLQQEGKNTYDLVFIDVESGGKDGYPLIQEVQRSCSNIAHVEICRNETSSDEILRAYKGGACSVLWKPVNEVKDEIVNLWRHVCRIKEQLKASETHLSNNNNVMPETHLSNNNNVMPETHLSDVEHMRKHETSETYLNNSDYVYHGDYIQQNGSVPLLLQNQNQGCSSLVATDEDEFLNYGMESPPRKRRVVWTGRLQECFLEAVYELGGPDKAVPKRILEKIQEKMHAPELTRENVGSHLQKYRQQMTKDRELHDNHSLANLPMQTQIQPSEQNLNNFVRVATLSTVPSSSLVGNGSNNGSNNLSSIIEELNLTSSDSSRIPASGTYVTTTRVNPQVRNAFASRMLQRRQIGVAVHQNQNSTMYHQLDRYVRGPNKEGIQAMGTSFASNTSAQQLDPNLASGSSSHVSTNYNGFINQNPALGTSLGTTIQEFSNMMQTPPNPTSSMQQVLQNPSSGSGIINQNPSSGSGMINQNEVDEYFLPPK